VINSEEPEIRMLPPIVPHLEIAPVVRLTGRLQPLQRKDGEGLHTLRVFIGRKEWLFQLEDIETLTGTNRGWTILNEIFPSELRLIDSEDLIGPLQQPEMAGKLITVEGRLYAGDRTLVVTAAAEGTDKPV
jgi:hypothetical protein